MDVNLLVSRGPFSLNCFNKCSGLEVCLHSANCWKSSIKGVHCLSKHGVGHARHYRFQKIFLPDFICVYYIHVPRKDWGGPRHSHFSPYCRPFLGIWCIKAFKAASYGVQRLAPKHSKSPRKNRSNLIVLWFIVLSFYWLVRPAFHYH